MSEGKRCTRCFGGVITGGVCSRCHQPEQLEMYRPTTALPGGTYLHNRYLVGDVLGKGGFGITYSAWDTYDNHTVALKELYPSQDVLRDADRLTVTVVPGQEGYFEHVSDCFVNEARILMDLQGQQGVVPFYNLFDENGTYYYTMEYLEGTDLRAYLKAYRTLTWPQMAHILRPVLKALDVLHSRNLIHRDISPDNIFITVDNNAMLIDFGSVRMYQGKRSFTTFMKQNFAPWEQYQANGNQGPWTDIYSLCVTVYLALSGELPPKAPDRRLKEDRETIPLAVLCPRLPRGVAAAIQKGMAVRPEDRFQSVSELTAALFPMSPPPQAMAPSPQPMAQYGRVPSINVNCVSGPLRGARWTLTPNSCIRFGRQQFCEVRYPQDYLVVSRYHCTIAMDQSGRVLVRDENSQNGTWINNSRIRPGAWYGAARGSHVFVAQDDYMIQ